MIALAFRLRIGLLSGKWPEPLLRNASAKSGRVVLRRFITLITISYAVRTFVVRYFVPTAAFSLGL
jgi:hypothetical protein